MRRLAIAAAMSFGAASLVPTIASMPGDNRRKTPRYEPRNSGRVGLSIWPKHKVMGAHNRLNGPRA